MAEAEKPAEDKEGGLEKRVQSGFIKNIAKTAAGLLAIGAAAGIGYVFGGIPDAAGTASLAASYQQSGYVRMMQEAKKPQKEIEEKKKEPKRFTTQNFMQESFKGLVGATSTYLTVKTAVNSAKNYGLESTVNVLGASIPHASILASAITLGGAAILSNLVYSPLSYVIEKRTFKGLVGHLRKNYISDTIRHTKYFAMPAAVMVGASVALPLYAPYVLLSLAGLNLFYRSRTLNPFAVLNPFPLFGAVLQGAYGILYNGIYKPLGAVASALSPFKAKKAAPAPAKA